MTPKSRLIIEELKKGTLDYQQAKKLGVERLSANICECRQYGYDIRQTMVGGVTENGKRITYAIYRLGEGEKECKPRAEEILWDCKCPMCGTMHQKYLFWTGNGTPRFYCRRCSEVVI
jgi:hypothetical protein